MEKELQNNAVTIATPSTTLVFMQSQLAEIKTEIKTLNQTFASKEELMQTARTTEERIVRLENASNFWRWASPTLAAAFGATLAYLLQYYIIGTFR